MHFQVKISWGQLACYVNHEFNFFSVKDYSLNQSVGLGRTSMLSGDLVSLSLLWFSISEFSVKLLAHVTVGPIKSGILDLVWIQANVTKWSGSWP